MPLQQLVQYFNERFEHEYKLNFRPFILEDGRVSGLFGQIRIGSVLTPLRKMSDRTETLGHRASCLVSAYDPYDDERIDNYDLLDFQTEFSRGYDTLINLDRLTRTVHMLNYLPIVHLNGCLFIPVDPRHILGIPKDHGAYFAEVIESCGLSTHNVVISTSVSSFHHEHCQQLFKGLENYRQRGYRIALDIGYFDSATSLSAWLGDLNPNFIRMQAHKRRNLEHVFKTLDRIMPLATRSHFQTILKTDRPERISGFPEARIDWIEAAELNVSHQETPEIDEGYFGSSYVG